MGTGLTVMTKLESFELRFCSPQSRPDPASRPLPSHTRFVLPVLSRLTFEGVYEYLDLLARIHAPLLDYLDITSSMDLNSDVPQLQRLIGHSEELKAFNYAGVVISGHLIQLNLYPKSRAVYHSQMLMLDVDCGDWQLSSLAQGSSFPLTSALEELKIIDNYLPLYWKDDMENAQWPELLGPFTALKNLYLSSRIASPVFGALLELSGERVTEVLPALQNLFIYRLEDSRKSIKIFVAARRHAGRPVRVHRESESGSWDDITEDLASGD